MKSLVVILDKYGTVYPVVNECHPNPGSYPYYEAIGETVDWFCRTHASNDRVFDYIELWLQASISVLSQDMDSECTVQDVIDEIFWMDSSELSPQTIKMIEDSLQTLSTLPSPEETPTDYAQKIADYLNQKYLRVRAGGKFDYNREDTIYFRISSKGYDWRAVIIDFLWDTYKDPQKMPSTVWIGHDEETNPPETTLFYGSCSDLLEIGDNKVYESYQKRASVLPIYNRDRYSGSKSTALRKAYSDFGFSYRRFD